jgi:hypothetical protein
MEQKQDDVKTQVAIDFICDNPPQNFLMHKVEGMEELTKAIKGLTDITERLMMVMLREECREINKPS